jgi:hypothetical protein
VKTRIFSLLLLLTCLTSAWNQVLLLPSGSQWKFKSGAAEPWNWKDPGFNDQNWLTGITQMGYGDGDESTIIYPGPDWGNYRTYYFRKDFYIADTSIFPGGFVFSIKKDDAVIFYINGLEFYRNNLNSMAPTYNELAASSCLEDGNTWINFFVPPGLLHNDTNTLAVEVHQFENTGGDLSFDCLVNGITNTIPICIRGPYLQVATENGMTIKWRTNIKSDSEVRLGSVFPFFTDSVVNPTLTFNHEVKLTGLLPATKYYYSIGSSNHVTVQDSTKYFYTPGLAGSPYEIDVWVTGDCGTGYQTQVNTANAFLNHVGNKYMDAWLLLGDNAYNNGLDAEYHVNFFEVYKQYRFLGQTCIWPAPGNHDYNNTGNLNNRNTPYFQIFTVPDSAEAGGVISGTESYYSYNLGNAHFISLDSYGTESFQKMYDTTSLQALWLQADLAANTQPWTIVYWHHPPYTKGSHNSDTEPDLVSIRSKLLVILERYQVDLVLCGHSHQYERSKLMKGHYGPEDSFDSLVHHTDHSSGLYDGSSNSCPYYKETDETVNKGIVYVVAGNAGKYNTNTSAGWPHNAMYYSNTSNTGSLYLKINQNRLDAKFISSAGIVQDQFTMMKDMNRSFQLPTPTGVPVSLTASWPGAYYWPGTGDTTQTLVMSFTHDTLVMVEDPFQCFADTFHISISNIGYPTLPDEEIQIYPNPTSGNFQLEIPSTQQYVHLTMYSISGKQVYEKKWWASQPKQFIEPNDLNPGTYFIKLILGTNIYYKRIIIL